MTPKIIIDTNVIITALKSKRGASNKLLRLFGTKKFIPSISVPLLLEYEDVIKRLFPNIGVEKLNYLLDYLCAASQHTKIYYLWRPYLKDPKDDMVLELAIAFEAKFIVTYNKKNFSGIENLGIETITPKEFLSLIGELP